MDCGGKELCCGSNLLEIFDPTTECNDSLLLFLKPNERFHFLVQCTVAQEF